MVIVRDPRRRSRKIPSRRYPYGKPPRQRRWWRRRSRRPRRPARRRGALGRSLRALSTVFIISGCLLLLDAGLTLTWQEPISAVYAKLRQDKLDKELERLEAVGPTTGELRALVRLRTDRRRIAFLARRLRRRLDDGDAVGRIRIPEIGVSFVAVEGTQPDDLRKGPGRYKQTTMPGLPGTVAFAGHRTTYGAPFREVDRLDRGDEVRVDMPYARFTYAVERTQIVSPYAWSVIKRVRYDRLVLTACHPLYSAKQRIVVFARLMRTEPRGRALREA